MTYRNMSLKEYAEVCDAEHAADEQIAPGAPRVSAYDLGNMSRIIADEPRFDWFDAHLLRLIKKADAENRERLRTVYPAHVRAVEQWQASVLDQAMEDIHGPMAETDR